MYDPKCEELARFFLEDDPKLKEVASLAQHIQTAIEDWLSDNPLADPGMQDKRLPLASELTGSDPEFTGTLSTDEYIKSIRRPSE